MTDEVLRHWNYRIVRFRTDSETYLTIHECHYENGELVMWAPGDSAPLAETVDEMRAVLGNMLKACDKPILEASEMPGVGE